MSGWVSDRLGDNCMPFPFGLLCWLEDRDWFRKHTSEDIHRECELREECDLRHTGDCTEPCHRDCVEPASSHPPCPPEDWICKLHDTTLELCARLGVPILRGTWRKYL